MARDCNGRKRKRYTAFSDEDRAPIGRHAAENNNILEHAIVQP